MNTDGNFYLGRIVTEKGETTDKPLLYDPGDLTTHAVVVGMTGSGKTGLCLDLLEEAALNNIPALMIDPKGDITNALLHFPDLLPADFAPWVNANEARREGKSVEQAAQETAELWRNGLASWDITPERIQKLKNSVQFAVYTPGSDAGLQVSILASLKAPEIPWAGNEELLREKISGTVTALLGLIGMKDIDPVRSREHILLSNIFETAWMAGKDLNLGELIMQTQSPPFEKLGVFDVNTFFPEKDRFELAMLLNNILAAPAFQTWIQGEPLDIASMLYMPDGTPRHTIFYIAHLSEAERMFFVTLLYSAVESWMRAQKGTTSLRALVYFDEIFGYLPPVGNPPSKEPMLRMLKQARAFGVGLVLATQNPVDVDYKALSNAGTWFIGKLGTDQDKQRLLDGLATIGGLDRGVYDELISALGKRVFLLRNVHEKRPLLFQTRWAMNYLAGPLMRSQIPALNELAGALPVGSKPSAVSSGAAMASETAAKRPQPAPEPEPELSGSETRPAVPSGVAEFFLPQNLTVSEAVAKDGRSLPAASEGILYRPVLLAQANVLYRQRKYNLDYEQMVCALVPEPDRNGRVRWEQYEHPPITKFDRKPAANARFAMLEEPFTNGRTMKSMASDFVDWVYRGTAVSVKANEQLKLYAGPDVSQADFLAQCQKAAAEKAEAEADKAEAAFEKKIDRLEDKLKREERELEEDEADYKRRQMEEAATHAQTIFGLFSKRRRSISSSMTKRRLTAQAKEDIQESKEEIERLQQEITELENEMQEAMNELQAKWQDIADDITEIPVSPYKKDIDASTFGVAWFPYFLVPDGNRLVEVAAFGVDE
jgi:hypothetical protein